METQIIANLLNNPDNKTSKFATRKWYIINDQNNGQYGKGDEDNDSTIKFETTVIKPFLCDYSEPYILVTGDKKVTGINADTNVVFKNCAPFTRCATHISEEHFETAKNLDIVLSMYNLVEYSNNYADASGSLYQFRRDESPINNAGNPLNVALDNSTSFKYRVSLLEKATDGDNDRSLKNAKNSSAFEIFIQFF